MIDFSVTYAQSLIDDFSQPEKNPHIAVSVDMLDTGIDVPEVVNLVFFKQVRSKTKFWQMVGRGTRLCPDLFGPGKHKKFFYIFDFCENLEFFNQDPETVDGSSNESLSKKLFVSRVDLIAVIDATQSRLPEGERDEAQGKLREDLADRLHLEVAAMNLDNFLVRAKRRSVERFAQRRTWANLTEEDGSEAKREVSGLPSSVATDNLEAKQFDLLLLNMQLVLLRGEPGFVRMQANVQEIARLLEAQSSIPVVRAKLPLIQEVRSDAYWEEVSVIGLERVRQDLRELVQFIERRKRAIVVADFIDTIHDGQSVDLPGVSVGVDTDRVREKATHFLQQHENDPVIHKLKFNDPLSTGDLQELEAIFLAEGSSVEEIRAASQDAEGLGLFVRSIVGMDKGAAKDALSSFVAEKNLTGNQIVFVDLIVNYLTQRGWVDVGQLYESPFTDIHHNGIRGVFDEPSTLALLAALNAVRQNALGDQRSA